jgi:protein-L-isoaspartate O-methyltransferase
LFFEILTFNFTKIKNFNFERHSKTSTLESISKCFAAKGITDVNVLKNKKNSKTSFFESSFEDYAYQDKAFPIGAGQTISQTYTVAFQSTARN